jgi:hypothetical protein
MHPLELIHATERHLDDLRHDADHRRLLKLARGAGRASAD